MASDLNVKKANASEKAASKQAQKKRKQPDTAHKTTGAETLPTSSGTSVASSSDGLTTAGTGHRQKTKRPTGGPSSVQQVAEARNGSSPGPSRPTKARRTGTKSKSPRAHKTSKESTPLELTDALTVCGGDTTGKVSSPKNSSAKTTKSRPPTKRKEETSNEQTKSRKSRKRTSSWVDEPSLWEDEGDFTSSCDLPSSGGRSNIGGEKGSSSTPTTVRSNVRLVVGRKGSHRSLARRRREAGRGRATTPAAEPTAAAETAAADTPPPKLTRRKGFPPIVGKLTYNIAGPPDESYRPLKSVLGPVPPVFENSRTSNTDCADVPPVPGPSTTDASVASTSGSSTLPASSSASNAFASTSAASTSAAGEAAGTSEMDDEVPPGLDLHLFDQEIHRKATKAKMSVRNVKHIIKSIISNEQVLAMMEYEASRETNPTGAALPPSLEPKMTRSRTRQLLADSQLTQLPLTPVKRPATASSTEQLILQEFPEDDDDEEYTPCKAVDLSGVTSSPSSPTASSPTPSTPCSASVCSSLPQTPATPASVVSEAEEPPSRRTRSRLPLTDHPLEELERLLVPPDVTPDMYVPVDDDDDWAKFLQGFNMPVTNHDAQEDEEDEEYVFQMNEDVEVEREELRADPAVRIPQKEVNKLMLELFKDVDELQWAPTVEPEPDPNNHICARLPPEPKQAMTESHARQLDHQMAAHVQLLAQTHLLCSEHQWLHAERVGCAALLVELNSLSSALHPAEPTRSFFCPPNLAPALEMVAETDSKNQEELSENASKFFNSITAKKKYCRLSDRIVDTILDSTAFVFPELLPRVCALMPEEISNPNASSHSSDQLIAMGLEMFTEYARCGSKRRPNDSTVCSLIAKYMMPFKKRKLVWRIQNARKTNDPNNPIVYYMDKHRAPPLPINDTLPVFPLKPFRKRVKTLQDPWYSLALRGNAFFYAAGMAVRGRLLYKSRQFDPPPVKVPKQCSLCKDPDFEQLFVDKRMQGVVLTDCKEAIPASTRRHHAQMERKRAAQDILAMCMPTIMGPTPTSSPVRRKNGDSPRAAEDTARDPDDPQPGDPGLTDGTERQPQATVGLTEERVGRPQEDGESEGQPGPMTAPGSEQEEQGERAEPEPMADLVPKKSTPVAHKTIIRDASDGEELVSVVNEEEATAPDITEASDESCPAAPGVPDTAAANVTVSSSEGVVRLMPAEGSVIELREEDNQLVVYIRGPGRPALRVPVRAPPVSTRLLLPPTMVLQETAAGRPAPGAAKRTGIVVPTVRQQDLPSPPPAAAPVGDEPPPPGSPESPPPPLTKAAALTPSPPTKEDDQRVFKQPFVPHKLRRSPRRLKTAMLPQPPAGGVVTEVFSVTSSTADSAASSDAGRQSTTDSGAASTSAAVAGLPEISSDAGDGPPLVNTADTAQPGAADPGAPEPGPASSAGPSGSCRSGWPSAAAGLGLSDLPSMVPPSLMTPRRPSPPPADSGLVFGFPTPSITPAPGVEGRDATTPAHGLLETPLVQSPPGHALLETPQVHRSPPRSPHTPPPPSDSPLNPPPPPPTAGSSDSHSTMSLTFFRRTIGHVMATAAAAAAEEGDDSRPTPDLTSEQSLGGVLDVLLTRRTGEPSLQTAVAGQPDVVPPPAAAAAAAGQQQGETADSAAPAAVPAGAPGPTVTEQTADRRSDPAVSKTADEPPAVGRPAGSLPPPAAPAAAAAAAPAAGGGRSQGVRTRSEAASGAAPQRAAPAESETKPSVPAEAAEETAAQVEEDRELSSAAALPAGRSSRPKRSRQQREAELTRLALAPESPNSRERREHALAHSYFQRVKECTETIDPSLYERFQELLTNFAESSDDEASLYDSVRQLLGGFPDLAEEFLMFISPDVAVRRGVVTEHVRGVRLQELARRIDAVNSAHPAQIMRLTRTLTQLASRGDEVSAVDLQAAVQPLVRACPLLSAQLTSLIDSESPAAELTRRQTDYQTAALDAEPAGAQFEEVTELAADEPDPYGTESCPCGCHQAGEDVRFLQRRRHCERCGLRFMAGRVYLQTGKVLRPARVISCSEPEEPVTAAAAAAEPAADDSSPPAKRARRRTGPKAERGRRPRPSTAAPAAASPPPPAPTPPPPAAPAAAAARESVPEPAESGGQEPSEAEPRAKEGSGQGPEPAPWSREDDLEILTSCQQNGDDEKTFRAIQRRLPERTVAQLQARFQRLMEMLREQLQQEPEEFMAED